MQTTEPNSTDVVTNQWISKKSGNTVYEVTRTYKNAYNVYRKLDGSFYTKTKIALA